MKTVSYALLERHTNEHLKIQRTIVRDARKLIEALGFKGEFSSRAKMVQPGAYKHFRRSEAISQYLSHCCLPQTAEAIDEAITRGEAKSIAVNSLAATHAALRYGKETGRFRLYGTKHWTFGN